jgi:hypothetical protein
VGRVTFRTCWNRRRPLGAALGLGVSAGDGRTGEGTVGRGVGRSVGRGVGTAVTVAVGVCGAVGVGVGGAVWVGVAVGAGVGIADGVGVGGGAELGPAKHLWIISMSDPFPVVSRTPSPGLANSNVSPPASSTQRS